jgi:hypothetical protein
MAMSALAILCACSLSVHPHHDVPKGRLGHPLGTYLTIEGVRAEAGKVGTRTLLVDTVNGKKLDRPIGIWIDNVAPLPKGERCILRGYESGKMIGVPDEVARAENLPLPQAAWQFFRYFIMTSVVQPEGLDRSLKPMIPGASPQALPGRPSATLDDLVHVDAIESCPQHPLVCGVGGDFPAGHELPFRNSPSGEFVHAVFPEGVTPPETLDGKFVLRGHYQAIQNRTRYTWKQPPKDYRYFVVSSWEYRK